MIFLYQAWSALLWHSIITHYTSYRLMFTFCNIVNSFYLLGACLERWVLEENDSLSSAYNRPAGMHVLRYG